MTQVLIVLLVVLTVVTLVGHAIWVVLSAILRVLFGSGLSKREITVHCGRCGRRSPMREKRCQWCGTHLYDEGVGEQADLAAFRRQVQRFREAGILDASAAQGLLAKAEEYQSRQTGVRQEASPAVVPAQRVTERPAAVTAPPPASPPSSTAGRSPLSVPAPAATAPPRSQPVTRPAVVAGPKPKPQQPPPPPAPVPPPASKKSWMELAADFLEERNIRLAEIVLVLVGGLLIVGGSVAVVVSFWNSMGSYLKFSVFVALSSLAFGLGWITYYRWKLEITGRAWLTIATLLVPLNFLAVASIFHEEQSLLLPLAELGALGVFAYLVGLASRVLVPGPRWPQVLAVVGNSAAVVLVSRITDAWTQGWPILAAGAIPVGIFGAALAGGLRRGQQKTDLDANAAAGLFSLLGTAVFTLAAALGLLIAKGAEAAGLRETLQSLAPLFSLAAAPVLAAGLAIMRGTSKDRGLGAHCTAGTAVALVAVAVMLAALVGAWPRPSGLVAAGLFNAAALGHVAFRHRLPIAQAGAMSSAAVVYLVGFHLATPDLSWANDSAQRLAELLVSARSGTALVGLFLLLAIAAEWLARHGRRQDAAQYAGGCAVVAMASLALVTLHGLWTGRASEVDAMVVYGVYGAGSLAMAARWQRRQFTYLGLALLVGASLWGLWRQTAGVLEGLWPASLAGEALAFGILAAVLGRAGVKGPGTGRSERLIETYRLPLLHAAELVGIAALSLAVWTAQYERNSPGIAASASCLAGLTLLTAWIYRSRERTWIASGILLLGLIQTLAINFEEVQAWLERPGLLAILVHATLMVLASLALRIWVCRREPGTAETVRRVFVGPLNTTGMLSSLLALCILVASPGQDPLRLAVYLFWVAAIWLLFAATERWPSVFSAAQMVLTAAVVAATTAWLQRNPWDASLAADYLDPRSLQVYGIGLGLLTLFWLVMRLALGRNEAARPLLETAWPGVDRLAGHAVVAGQFLLAAACATAAFRYELVAGTLPVAYGVRTAFGPAAWIVLGTSAACIVPALWRRWREAEVVAAVLIAATVPCLVAGQAAGAPAAASTMRWAASLAFVVGAAAIWNRQRLERTARRLGGTIAAGPAASALSQGVLLATTALPVLALTLVAALRQLAGVPPVAPPAGNFFAEVGPRISYLLPLVLVTAGLVGFAVRQSSAGYAFAAGLVVEMTVVLGYALALATGGTRWDTVHTVTALQLATITAAAWAILWIAGRRRLDVWREDGPVAWPSRGLMNVQLGLSHLGNLVLLVPALLSLILTIPGRTGSEHEWARAAGSPWGWIALAAALAAAAYRQFQGRGRVQPGMAGLVGMAALGLLACTVRGLLPDAPEWGYRTLMLGWAAYSVFIVAATWWVASVRTLPGAAGPPQALVRAAAGWTAASGVLAVLLGLKAAFLHPEPEEALWGAAAIALAAAAGATMAVWRRQEGWAFIAAPGVNLAASLVVWYIQWQARGGLALRDWWVLLVQANIIASAAVALVWLAARKRLYELGDFSVRTSPLLGVQTSLGVIACAVVFSRAALEILVEPGRVAPWTAELAQPAGWAALLLVTASAVWYLRQISPRDLVHVTAGSGLGVGVLLAGSATQWDLGDGAARALGDWLGFHVLLESWAAAGLVLLALGILARNFHLGSQEDPNRPERTGQQVFPAASITAWVSTIAAAVFGSALLSARTDPGRPWWSVAAILAAGLAAGVLGMWRRLPLHVAMSGLSINAAATVLWIAWCPWRLGGLIETNILGLAIASVVWSLVRPLHTEGVPAIHAEGRPQPFAHWAAILGLALLGLLTEVLVLCDVLEIEHAPADPLGWMAAAATAAALLVLLTDRTARFTALGLWLTALFAHGLSLDARQLAPRVLAWTAAHELALFVLATAAAGLLFSRSHAAGTTLREPDGKGPDRSNVFLALEAMLTLVVGAISAWIAIDLDFDPIRHPLFAWLAGRLAGPLASAFLLPATVLLARQTGGRWRAIWQSAVLATAVLALSETGWALLAPEAASWMHRGVILMVAAIVMMLVTGFGLARWLPPESDWRAAGRRSVPVLAGLFLGAMTAVLALEVQAYEPYVGARMAMPAVAVTAAAMAGLVLTCLAMALVPRWDSLRLTDRGRQGYVYAAEALIVLICAHLRLTVPDLFRLEIMAKYWMLIVLGAAFAGAGLSELFRRRGMPVLSQPLERTAVALPLAVAVGFWFVPQFAGASPLAGDSAAAWFLMAAFYGLLAVSRRTDWRGLVCTLAAMAAGNIGLCVLWVRHGWGFLEHPQLWLVPIGLSVLAAEHLNRGRLAVAQSAAIRYLALSAIYIPSCSQYLGAIGQEQWLWLALVSILLSLAGVLAGILLRIRSFLYLGVTFLGLVVVTMIRYAAVTRHQMWVLYLCVIVLGTAVIAMVALFERHRDAILAAVKQFRQWQR